MKNINGKSIMKKNGKKPLNIMFGDLCYLNRQTIHAQYVPLAIGMIAQYAIKEFGDEINVSLFKEIDKFLDKATQNPPDVVGLSVYYWNLSINQYLVKCIRQKFGKDIIIVLGGPCIDSDEKEQINYLTNVFPDVDAIVINEGEIAFNNIIRKILDNRKTVFKDPIDGASFLDGNNLIQGRPVGLTMDLSKIDSPYLTGLLDEFMKTDFQPLLQTARFCPYTCTFCVEGKNRGKLRAFPIEMVKEELNYISKKYNDRPHHTLFLVDFNFGIIKRDVEIAEHIKKCKDDFGFPQSVMFYNDKRFTENSRQIHEILKDQAQLGVSLALQTDNPLALKASNRRNVTGEEIDSAIAWAKSLGIYTSTDLIFGLPLDTRDSFVNLLDSSIEKGFDDVNVRNLILMDGIEMNRQDFRKQYNINTKYRILGTHYGKMNGNFIAEYEEMVVSSNSFTYDDYLEIRYMNFMFYAVFNLNFQKWFIQFVNQLGINSSKFFSKFVKPDRNDNWPKEYIKFLDSLREEIEKELHDTREEMIASAKKIYEENNNDVGESVRINSTFGSQLTYLEKSWVKPVLLRHLNEIMNGKLSNEDKDLASLLIDLSELEQVDLKNISEKKPLSVSYDLINWKKNKFKEPLRNLKMPEKLLKFSTDKNQTLMIEAFKKRHSNSYNDRYYYYKAIESFRTRRFLLHNLSYEEF